MREREKKDKKAIEKEKKMKAERARVTNGQRVKSLDATPSRGTLSMEEPDDSPPLAAPPAAGGATLLDLDVEILRLVREREREREEEKRRKWPTRRPFPSGPKSDNDD